MFAKQSLCPACGAQFAIEFCGANGNPHHYSGQCTCGIRWRMEGYRPDSEPEFRDGEWRDREAA